MSVQINLSLATPQQYNLLSTATDPAQGGCASAQPLPGVNTVTVGQQGGVVQFNWPAALPSGPYWLCAQPRNGSGPAAQSATPFTVTTTPAPTATRVNPDNSPASAYALVPANGAPAGSTLTVLVTGWTPSDGSAPSTVTLAAQDSSGTATMPFRVSSSGATGPGSYNLAVSLPSSAAPGRYVIEVGMAYQVSTQSFWIVAASAPAPATVTPTPAASSGDITIGGVTLTPVALAAPIGVLLLLAVSLIVPAVVRRKRAALHKADGQTVREPR